MKFVYDDGGRAAAGFKGSAGDCACRAIAIATESNYVDIYKHLNLLGKEEKPSKKRRGSSTARSGVHHFTMRLIMAQMGWNWTPTMDIGTGCRVHMRLDELPMGRIILSLSRHYCAVIDGVAHDTHDPSRGGTRCVYGYWSKADSPAQARAE